MKKLFSLFAAVLFAGSMMASNEEKLIFSTDAGFNAITITTAGASSTGADYEFSKDSVTVTGTKGYIYNKKHSVFKGGTMVVSVTGATIDSISVTYNSACYPFVELPAVLVPEGEKNAGKTNGVQTRMFVPTGTPTSVTFSNASNGKTELKDMTVYYTVTTPAGWDGTVSLSKTEFRTLEDLEGLTLTFNDATSLTLLDEESSMIAFQNEDGSKMYAIWAPVYEGTYSVEGNVVTLNNWYASEGETSPLPTENGAVYFEDYGSFIVDGDEEAIFETAEASYIAPVPTTYTVTYTVTDFDAEHCLLQAGYFNEEETVSGEFAAGTNTVPENVYAYVNAVVVDDYTVEVKVNGAAVELIDGQWYSESVITADMTIDVTFTAPVPGPDVDPWATTYTTNVEFTAGTNSYLTDKIIIDETEYNAYKIGTSSKAGNCSVTLPAGTESFHFHAICWSKTADTDLKISGAYEETVVIKAANISGTSPYTFDLTYADPTERYYAHEFVAPLTEAATVTFSCDYRAVFFGVNAVVKSTPTAVENIEAVKATKVMVNGQMLIIRDGKTYNVMGMQF